MTSAPVEGRGCTVQLFNGHRYQLDYYQREYTWGSENVRRLVEDLHRRFSAEWDVLHDRRDTSRYKPYFLGPYVYFQDGDITFLVDGQQRVTTLHLLLILIRKLLLEQDAVGEARQLETLICNVMYGERRYTIDIAERAPAPMRRLQSCFLHQLGCPSFCARLAPPRGQLGRQQHREQVG